VYGLSDADLELAGRARAFVDELIPHEAWAELHAGELPPELAGELEHKARDLGLTATNIPLEHGGRGCTTLQQVLVQEQAGRATNALGWVLTTPPAWFCPVATAEQAERYLHPTVRGEIVECYAISEEGAGSDVDALAATAAPDGAGGWLLDGEKWHVTSYNHAAYAFFQAKLTAGEHAGEHAMFLVDLPSPGVRVVRTPAYSHTIAHHHPIVAFEGVRAGPGQLVGGEGGGMG
jgi:acyl-CoA dehydrogenase